jgi:hypothetical protein
MLALKFDGGLSTSPCEKKRTEKPHFFASHFSCEQNGQPNFKFDIYSEVLFIYRLIPKEPDFLGCLAIFDTTPINRF